MDTNRAFVIAVVINLTWLCFSGQVMAYQRSNEVQLYSDYDIDTASLASLYKHPDNYLWLNKRQLKHQATYALEFIADSVNHGLNPNDYHFDLLQQLDPTSNESEAQLFDLVLSDGLLKVIRDISIGRLDPGVVDPKWSIPRKSFNATAFLQHALSTNDFKASLNSLTPVSKQYLQLKAALARYQDYVARGGWQNVPATAVLRRDDEHINIAAIRDRLSFEDDSINQVRPSKSHYYDKELEQVVKKFQRRHSLIADGIIGPATIREMNVSAADRLQQININLERLRWLHDDLGDRYIVVNLANYRLTAIEDDEVKLDMRVIVGKTKRSTPSFSSQMTHIVLNPKWYVPNKLARLDLLPKQQANPGYFERYNFRVFKYENGITKEINPESVDWQTMSKQYFPYTLVQDPGKKNALGQLKFILPNPWKIYLHDTPSKSLFNQSRRNFSAGCIRVEDPLALASFSLSKNSGHQPLLDIISSNENYTAELEQPLSVFAIYATVWPNGDEVMFSPDIYRRDQRMAEYL